VQGERGRIHTIEELECAASTPAAASATSRASERGWKGRKQSAIVGDGVEEEEEAAQHLAEVEVVICDGGASVPGFFGGLDWTARFRGWRVDRSVHAQNSGVCQERLALCQ